MSLYPLVDGLMRPFMLRAYKIRHIGLERVPQTGPVVLAANHESILDPWFLGTVTKRPVHYLTKAELFRYPLLRQVLEGGRVLAQPALGQDVALAVVQMRHRHFEKIAA